MRAPAPMRRRNARPPAWAAWLALLALWLGAFAPPGFMPGFARGAGAFAIVICSGVGLRTIQFDERGAPREGPDGAERRSGCVYASAASVALPPPSPLLAGPALWAGSSPTPRADAPPLRSTSQAHGARAPPPFASFA